MKIDWSNMGNTDIRMKLSSMEKEYEAIKMKINSLVSELDKMDIEYNNGRKELEKRIKK